MVKKHKAIRASCKHCDGSHSTSQHDSHGYYSYEKTHFDAKPSYKKTKKTKKNK